MSSSTKRILISVILAGAVLWTALRFMKGPSENSEGTAGSADASAENTVETPTPTPALATPGSAAEKVLQAAPPSSSPPPFGAHLREIGTCLEINNTPNDSATSTLADLQASMKPALGEIIGQDLEWKNVHFTLPNGEKRRMRLEVEGTGEESSSRRVKLYGVDAEDLPVPLPLSEEQSKNPTDTFLASLEKEGQVTMSEEAHRGAYAAGAELFYRERNGVLAEIELSYQGKTVKCQDINNVQGKCRCF